MEISAIGLGCWAFGGGAYWGAHSQRDAEAVVRLALSSGVSFFDTARMYNDGASEVSLGEALDGLRGKAVICSKASPARAYKDTLRAECEQTLRNLRSDYVDIYMLHWPINPLGIRHFTNDEAVLASPPTNEEAFRTLMDLKREGKIREIGVSNFGVTQLKEALAICPDIVVNELPYNIVSRAVEAEILPFCKRNGIGVIASMALQQGVLTGRYKSAEEVPPPQAHSRHFKQERGGTFSRHYEDGAEEELFEAVRAVNEAAAEMGVTAAQLSVAWVLDNAGVASALAGSRKESNLLEIIEADKICLNPEIRAKIAAASQKVLDKLGASPDYYENSKTGRIY